MEFAKVARTRRAVNHFDPKKDVSEETVRSIIELAALSPSSFDLQPWNLIILRDPISVGHFDTSRELLPPKWRKSYDEIVISFQ